MRLGCRRYRWCISDYCLGELDKAEQEQMEQHLQKCSHCGGEVEFAMQMIVLLADRRRQRKLEVTDEMSEQLRAKLYARIEKEEDMNTERVKSLGNGTISKGEKLQWWQLSILRDLCRSI